MKKSISALLVCALLMTGCSVYAEKVADTISESTESSISTEYTTTSEASNSESPAVSSVATTVTSVATEVAPENTESVVVSQTSDVEYNMSDPEFLQYIQDDVYAELDGSLGEDEFYIDSVSAIYLSQEYIDELAYNSLENIYFGYTRSQLDAQFEGTKYVFTVDDEGKTVVREAGVEYDDEYYQMLTDLAIGAGVIVVCVVVTIISRAAGATTVCAIFGGAAKTGAKVAIGNGVITGAFSGIIEGIKSNDFSSALREGLTTGAKSFKWGAIIGVLTGGISAAVNAYRSSRVAAAADELPAMFNTGNGILNTPQQSEELILNEFGGSGQISFLNGTQVPYGTVGSTRPDVVQFMEDGTINAIEVKNYDLENNLNGMINTLVKEIGDRVENLPANSTQQIVVDVTNRGYSADFLGSVRTQVQTALSEIYPNIPVIFWEA